MKLKITQVLLLAIAIGHNAIAANKTIECSASGKSLAKNGEGMTKAKGTFTFTESQDGNGKKVLKDIKGKVETFDNGDDEVIYSGNFNIPSLAENPKYKPVKYKNASQFKDFNDTSASGDMWGALVLEDHSSSTTFKAHYIFQAGDHEGGTLHMSCKDVTLVNSEPSAEDTHS